MFLRGYSFIIAPGDEKDQMITLLSYFGGEFVISELVRSTFGPPPTTLYYKDTYLDLVNIVVNNLEALKRRQIAYRQFFTRILNIIPLLEEFLNTWMSMFWI